MAVHWAGTVVAPQFDVVDPISIAIPVGTAVADIADAVRAVLGRPGEEQVRVIAATPPLRQLSEVRTRNSHKYRDQGILGLIRRQWGVETASRSMGVFHLLRWRENCCRKFQG